MQGIQIFSHSLRQVTANLPAALKISGLLYLCQIGATLVFGQSAFGSPENMMHGAFSLGLIVVLLVAVLTSVWIAVAWHRFVLRGEMPTGVFPAPMTDRMLAYFLRSLLIAVVIIVGGMILGAIVGLVIMPVMMSAPLLGFVMMALLVQLPLIFIGLRLATNLPGVALGTPGTFLDGWNATASDWKSLLQLAVIMAVIMLAVNLMMIFVFGGFGPLAMIWQFVANWFVTMVGLSVLTTLYGHYIEKRPLV